MTSMSPLHEDIYQHLPGTGWRCDDLSRNYDSDARTFKYDRLDMKMRVMRNNRTNRWIVEIHHRPQSERWYSMNRETGLTYEQALQRFWQVLSCPHNTLMEVLL